MRSRLAALALAGASVLAACGGDDVDVAETGDAPTTTEAPEESSSTTTSSSTSTTAAADPADAATDAAEAFLAAHFPGTAATLSEFRQGDNRSGEIDVVRPGEGGASQLVASTLLLRQDDTDAWQVFAAFNANVTITEPAQDDIVTSPLTVSGTGRGFEGTLVARAFDGGEVVAEGVGMGGALETPEPYEIELDLASVEPGTELVVVVAGGTGLEGDPGEFSAVRVTA